MNTPFDRFFDYDRNGELDCFEKGARDAAIMSIIGETETETAQEEENDEDEDGN